jgi:hypothetical protein
MVNVAQMHYDSLSARARLIEPPPLSLEPMVFAISVKTPKVNRAAMAYCQCANACLNGAGNVVFVYEALGRSSKELGRALTEHLVA